MRSIQLKLLFFVACFINSSLIFAQYKLQAQFKKIDEENGLSDNNVQCIYKDRNEFVWIGTASGLNLMNGSDITVFKHEPTNPNSVTNNNITAISGDNSGLIWIGTGTGLNSFNPSTHLFSAFQIKSNLVKNNSEGYVTTLAIDKKNNVYSGTTNGLFFLKSGEKNARQIEIPGTPALLLKNNSITDLALDSAGTLWITNYNGVWKYIPGQKNATQVIGQNILFTRLLIDRNGKIWLGTYNNGLKNYDPYQKELFSFGNDENVSALAEVKDASDKNELWLGGEFLVFDLLNHSFFKMLPPADFPKNIEIQNVYTSADNWLWLGTEKGLYFCNPAKSAFLHHTFSKAITAQQVPLLDWNGKTLVGGEGKNFLKSYDSRLVEKDNYSKNIPPGISCLSLRFSGKDEVIAGTSKGIAKINLITHQVQFNHLEFLAKDISSGNFITNVFEDNEYRTWIFPWRQGIWRSDSGQQHFVQVFKSFKNENDYPKNLVISDAIENKNNDAWFADLDEGIIYYHKTRNSFSKPFAKQLGDFYRSSQILHYQNHYYSFTASQILKWSADNSFLQRITLPSEFDKQISSIAFDSSRHLWIATGKGLLEYDFNAKTFERFTEADGLISNNMDGILYCKKNGTMVFGSPDFLTSFEPQKLLAFTHHTPRIRLVEITANGKFVPLSEIRKMNFNHDVNNITVKWVVTDYNSPLKNHYYYQLKGIDTSWRYAGNRGEVEFASLSPGNYTLFLKAKNSNGINADKILQLRFEIMPPFWRTWWFFSLLFIAVCAFFYSLYKYRLKQVLKIEKLRNQISLDLHDDVGSTLSSISILSEMAMHKKENASLNMLNEIKENSISLMERMDDIVWSINPHNDTMESLFLRIKTFAAKLFEAKEINYKIDIDENIKQIHMKMENRQDIYLILKEAINNMVKYSECTNAEINISFHSGQLFILIKDNGKGFDTEKISFGNGLNSMKKRADGMNAFLKIDSESEEGTTINLSVKIK